MNWNDVSQKIAEKILSKVKPTHDGTYEREKVLSALKKAVMEGLIYECENWVTKRRLYGITHELDMQDMRPRSRRHKRQVL